MSTSSQDTLHDSKPTWTGEDRITDRVDLRIGEWVLDQFRIVETLGEGGSGRVYLAEQRSMDRMAAIKVLRLGSQRARDRFRNEARAISRLAHPHIVTVYNFGELADGSLFLAMEHVGGLRLDQLLSREGALPIARAIAIADQCCAALDFAHQKGVIHRDLKPQNVMLSEAFTGGDHVKVLDFGLARLAEQGEQGAEEVILGTPQYMSPEQCKSEVATAAADQYSLGLVLYQMLTGRPAFEADSVVKYLVMHQNQYPERPSTRRPDEAVQLLDPIVMRMLAKRPSERFASVEEIRGELERVRRSIGAGRAGSRPGPPVAPCGQDVRLPAGQDGVRPATPMGPVTKSERRPHLPAHSGRVRIALLGTARIFAEVDETSLPETEILARAPTPRELPADREKVELYILSAAEGDWAERRESWTRAGVQDGRMIVCVDAAPRTPRALAAIGSLKNVSIGRFPLDPFPVQTAMRWLRRSGSQVLHSLGVGAVQVIQITASAEKSRYVDSLMEDLEAQRVRPAVCRSVKAIAEELVMNAIFHAPVARDGAKLFEHLPRSSPVRLDRGQEAILKWSISEDRIAVSVRDPFGSLSSGEIITALSRPQSQEIGEGAVGAGLGLQIVLRSARHLIFMLSPGASCEVVALVDRDPSPAREEPTLSVIQSALDDERKIGERLTLRLVSDVLGVRIELRGEIDETVDLSPVFGRSGAFHLDLEGVTSMNSSGIVAWMSARKKAPPDQRLVMEGCPPVVVNQFNMIDGLCQIEEIGSFQLPFYCETCARSRYSLLTREELERGGIPDPPACPSCTGLLEYEEIPAQYFAFALEGE